MFILFDLDIHMMIDQEKQVDALFRGIPYSKKTRISSNGKKIIYLKNVLVKLIQDSVITNDEITVDFVDNIVRSCALQNETQKVVIRNSLLHQFRNNEQSSIIKELHEMSVKLDYKRVYKNEDIKILYSDGSFNKETEVGGYGVCELLESDNSSDSGFDLITGENYSYNVHKGATDEDEGTNNIGELMGIGKAMDIVGRAKKPISIIISDSDYSIRCVREWYYNWESNNWKTYNKKPVKNKELIQDVYSKKEDNLVLLCWTKAHVKTFFNEECDKLAKEAVGLKS